MEAVWKNHNPLLSRPILNPTMRVVSHGGGVQTSTLLVMAARGDIGPMPDAAIVADTGDEPKEVWEYLDYIEPMIPFPIYKVQRGDIIQHIKRGKNPNDIGQRATLPLYLQDGGQMMRTCTASLKIDAVTAKIREMMGLTKGQKPPKDTLVEVWIGISMDEKRRAGGFPAKPWQSVRYPLLEADMTRGDCERYLAERQIKIPPRSRCRICPYRSDESWRELSPEDFEHACRVDDMMREGGTPLKGMDSLAYLHRDRKPLRDVDLTAPSMGLPLEDDCFGVCGT
ncbi:hypothetical protein CMI47_05095 [Candidatus Pacearchaeota archaeon]|nr:hypothetical protein [Candidatus Pacearchaeota archaeon]|tara:strand:- start:3310 stop:4158 length:849 start_codon:yes stop_codon:yes gene_type:complete